MARTFLVHDVEMSPLSLSEDAACLLHRTSVAPEASGAASVEGNRGLIAEVLSPPRRSRGIWAAIDRCGTRAGTLHTSSAHEPSPRPTGVGHPTHVMDLSLTCHRDRPEL